MTTLCLRISVDLAAHLGSEPRRLDEIAEIAPTTLSFESLEVLGEGRCILDGAKAESVDQEFGVGRTVRRLVLEPQRSQAQIHLPIFFEAALVVRGAESMAPGRCVRTMSMSFLWSGRAGPAMLSIHEVWLAVRHLSGPR